MAHWLYPANTKFYDVTGAFSEAETFWPVNSKVEVGDTVYLYLAAPYKQIAYVADVVAVDIEHDAIFNEVKMFIKMKDAPKKESKRFMKLFVRARLPLDEASALSYAHLKEHGLSAMLMGPRKLEYKPELLTYIRGMLAVLTSHLC